MISISGFYHTSLISVVNFSIVEGIGSKFITIMNIGYSRESFQFQYFSFQFLQVRSRIRLGGSSEILL